MDIIKIAKDLFIRDSIHAVSMKQISTKTNISIRSLYYYYKNKDDLAIDIQIMELYKVFSGIEFSESGEKTGYENIVVFFNKFYERLIAEKKAIKYITAFDFYFYNGYPTDKYITFIETFISMNDLYLVFLKGVEDNSINIHGMNPELVYETIFHGFFALAQKNIYREKSFIEANRDKHNGDLQVFLKLFLESIKN